MNVAIFASGSGTNAENIIKYFNANNQVKINLVLCNKENAGVFDRAKNLNIETYYFNREMLKNGSVLEKLQSTQTDFIVLAGFLWLMPKDIIAAFPQKIVNIHPALLPKYGGKGMYGDNVHKAVVENKEKESGITIHYVNEEYDKGDVIFQAKCKVLTHDAYEDVANKVHALEYEHFPKVIASLLSV